MAANRDEVIAGSRWTFDQDVTAVFDDMLARSIPQYEVMRQTVHDLALRYMQPGSAVVDLGASRGEAVAGLIDLRADRNCFVLCEVSPPMLDVLRQRFASQISAGQVVVADLDLRERYPSEQASVTLSVLTLQFVPIEYRQMLVQRIYDSLLPGGAFILVEKVLGATARLNETLVDLYYDLKRGNGYTQEQIDRKRLSLEGVLVPVTADWNVELLKQAGFREIDNFWRYMNFSAWIAVK